MELRLASGYPDVGDTFIDIVHTPQGPLVYFEQSEEGRDDDLVCIRLEDADKLIAFLNEQRERLL